MSSHSPHRSRKLQMYPALQSEFLSSPVQTLPPRLLVITLIAIAGAVPVPWSVAASSYVPSPPFNLAPFLDPFPSCIILVISFVFSF
ncbi:hypothetical protein J3R83DRAFT_15 [Lanmaoa asiatica]|nr:hypothetical protein J3R83DRAFT_15 [Lanmaoa asiatica]